MFKYARRFFSRYSQPISFGLAVAAFIGFFYKPLHYVFIESGTKEHKNNPRVIKAKKEQEERKEIITKAYKAYKECKDPEERKRLYDELCKIHQNRMQNLRRDQIDYFNKRD